MYNGKQFAFVSMGHVLLCCHMHLSKVRMVHVRNCCLPCSSIYDCLQRYITRAVYTFSQRGTRAVASRSVKAPPPLRKQHHGGDPVRLLRLSLELARPMYHSKQFAFVCMGHVLLCCHLHPSRVRMGHVRKCCLPFSIPEVAFSQRALEPSPADRSGHRLT